MKFFARFRKEKIKEDKEVEKSGDQKASDALAVTRHEIRITNLENELEVIESDLYTLEGDSNIVKKDKEKGSNNMIRRMVLIKYEVGVRKELVEWLS